MPIVNVYTDSKASIDLIKLFESTPEALKKSAYRLTLKKIKNRMRKMMLLGSVIHLNFVYSHLLDTDSKVKRKDEKMKKMTDTYKEKTMYVLKGNKKVDEYTHSEDVIVSTGSYKITDESPGVLLMKNGSIIIEDTRKYILKSLHQKSQLNWYNRTTTASMYIKDQKIHRKNWDVLQRPSIASTKFANLRHRITLKAIQTNLNTRAHDSDYTNLCAHCSQNGVQAIETTPHVFSECPAAIKANDIFWEKITKRIVPLLPRGKKTMPATWLNLTTKPYSTQKLTGDIGLIPTSVISFFRRKGISEIKLQKIEKILFYESEISVMSKWTDRCQKNKEVFPRQRRRPPEPPDLPEEPPPSPHQGE